MANDRRSCVSSRTELSFIFLSFTDLVIIPPRNREIANTMYFSEEMRKKSEEISCSFIVEWFKHLCRFSFEFTDFFPLSFLQVEIFLGKNQAPPKEK